MSKKIVERKKRKEKAKKHVQKVHADKKKIELRQKDRKEHNEEKERKGKLIPIVNEVLVSNPIALANIEKNLQILKALEEDYIASQKAKANLHEELEAEGYKTIEEKMDALKAKAAEKAKEIGKPEEFFDLELKSIDEQNDS